ncbi:MAG: hypothetical protein RMI91_12625 [Gemmatales bacterium]|nr:hypothetical protein [Gemmatales bacterium]MDW7995487.1 hypothetical protein [Gemmatales bacterium]
MLREINILALHKGEEHYIFVYHEEARAEVVQVMREWASNPRLSFSWFDAAVLAQRVAKLSSTSGVRSSLAGGSKLLGN